jgi:signal transduction histidine kinase
MSLKHTVLIIDDEKDNLDALERIFRKKYEVLKALNHHEAMSFLKTKTISLIISDQRMPEMTGVELLAKSIALQPDAIRILLTGYTDIESVISAINSGQIYRYITKPWDPRELEMTVSRALERFEMSQELKQKNNELEEAYQELKTLDQAKSHFMILVNHELKTPLTNIINYLSLLKETRLSEDQEKPIQRLESSTERLKELIFDVLEFVSAETGHTKLNAKKNKFKATLEAALEPLKSQLEKKSQKIIVNLEQEQFVFDPQIMKSVLQRILHNAIKFGDEGSAITIKSNLEKDGHTKITVQNKGKSLDQKTIQKIMKPFEIDENIMNHSKGIGMGLSISQALLKLHGSHLEFESDGQTVNVAFQLES